MQAKIACRVAHGVGYLCRVYAEIDLRFIQPSNPSADPNSQAAAGMGTRGRWPGGGGGGGVTSDSGSISFTRRMGTTLLDF